MTMSKRSFRTALAVVIATVVLAGGVVVYFVHEALSYPDQRHAGSGVEVEIEIEPGMSFQRIAERLADKGVVDRPSWFRLYALHRGVANRVRTGRYVLTDDMTPRAVLDVLIEGVKEKQVEVTLPEGKHMLEYFAILAGHRADGVHPELVVADAEELERLARDPAFLRANAIEGDSVDGYLFPDTYLFVVPTKPERVLERLIAEHRKHWNELVRRHGAGYERIKKKLKWSDREILIMASIVEKEAVRADEQTRIAQVFINRLTDPSFKPKRLETDPTIRYGCQVPVRKSAACASWDRGDRLHRAQLDDKDNPYNTYQHEGLPPGPIANPGRGAIRAVLEPDGSDYFYFVAKDKTTHVFSRTLREHERNVDKYIRGKP
jgi:UPF0755 protein